MTPATSTIVLIETAVVRFRIVIRSSSHPQVRRRWRPSSLQRYTLTDNISRHDRNL